jgi:hypothetical protein
MFLRRLVMFKRRLGLKPDSSGSGSSGAKGCPDIWELENGNIAIIGVRGTASLKAVMPNSASCGIDEEIVILPRSVLLAAKKDISDMV